MMCTAVPEGHGLGWFGLNQHQAMESVQIDCFFPAEKGEITVVATGDQGAPPTTL